MSCISNGWSPCHRTLQSTNGWQGDQRIKKWRHMAEPKILPDLEVDVNESCDLNIKKVEAFCHFSKLSTCYIIINYYTNFHVSCLCDTYALFDILKKRLI
jgi:hypothetical protein